MPGGAGATRRVLVGYSGAELTLIEREGGPVVRKQARRAGQNERLRAQCAKLRAAHAQGLSCPEVVAEGEHEENYWFEMEYVAGENLGHAVVSGRDIDWHSVVAQILAMLGRFRGAIDGIIPVASFTRKLEDITRRCAEGTAVRPLLGQVERLAAELGGMDWAALSSGPCHGDLTLENVLMRQDGSLVFIDFDVPDQSSWELDVGKLYQDVYGQWFLRRLAIGDPDSIDLLNAQLNLAKTTVQFDDALQNLVPGGRRRICQFAAFHLMRTLPYATEPTVPRYVVRRIVSLLGTR